MWVCTFASSQPEGLYVRDSLCVVTAMGWNAARGLCVAAPSCLFPFFCSCSSLCLSSSAPHLPPPTPRVLAQRGLSWPNCTKQHPHCQPLRCLTAFKMPAILWHVIYLFCVCVCYASVPVESKLFGGRTGLFCFLLNLQKLHLTLRRDPPHINTAHTVFELQESRGLPYSVL